MPATKRPKPLYQRGPFILVARPGRANLQIVWYDDASRRERSISAGTADVHAARQALDRHYLTQTGGEAHCPTCGQPRSRGGVLVTAAIADYLTLSADKPSAQAIRARLAHVIAWLAATGQTALTCDRMDEAAVDRFRAWMATVPVISPTGQQRPRAPSTIENSVLQLAAAINAHGGTRAAFAPLPGKQVNRTPAFRADVGTLAAMFRWCLYPDQADWRSVKERTRRLGERAALLRFLRLSVATMARPDAALDFSLDPARRQWLPEHRIINLNPHGRRQTRKRRAVVPAAHQFAALLAAETATKRGKDSKPARGSWVGVASVRKAWDAMAASLHLPGEGEAGTKLIRRSMAHIARARLPQEAWGEVSMFLGHSHFDAVSDLYAPFSPSYLRRALAVVEAVIDEIESACPGAFYRSFAAQGGTVVSIGKARKPAFPDA